MEGCIAQDSLVRCDEQYILAVFTFEAGIKDTVNFDRIVYNFKRANAQGIVDTPNSIDWKISLSAENVDCVSEFYKVLNDAVNVHVPLMRIKNSTFPPWYTSDIKSCIFKKKQAHALWNSSHSPADRDEFKRLRQYVLDYPDQIVVTIWIRRKTPSEVTRSFLVLCEWLEKAG